VLRWTCWLLLWRTHPWPQQDDLSLGIVGGSHRGAPAIVATVVAGVIVLAFPLPLALTVAFATIVGGGVRRGTGRWKTR
jgi:hypothetical protein